MFMVTDDLFTRCMYGYHVPVLRHLVVIGIAFLKSSTCYYLKDIFAGHLQMQVPNYHIRGEIQITQQTGDWVSVVYT